jgi:hypothetical protein
MKTLPSIKLSRGHDGKGPLTAKSIIDLGFDRRELVIETGRSTKGLQSEAYVQQRSADGLFVSRAFGIAGRGDFSAVVAQREGARATEKALRALHEQALDSLDFVLERALRHYGRSAGEATQAAPADQAATTKPEAACA